MRVRSYPNPQLDFALQSVEQFFHQVAWAQNKGIKDSGHFKENWEVELGVTYVPWEQIPDDFERLAEGGMFDDDTLPENLKGELLRPSKT